MLAIRYYRQRKGWSQTTLANLVKVTQPLICNIELGHLRPNEKLLDNLASVLGVSPAFALLRPVEVQEQVVFPDPNEKVSA